MSVEKTASPFADNVRLGMVFIVAAASLSAIAVSCLLLYIVYSTAVIKSDASRTWRVSTHIHFYFVNLLFSDMIQAIGGIMTVRWMVDARVTEGPFCTAQGIFKQMGDVGVALTSLTIAVHTFCVLALRWSPPAWTAFVVVPTIWIFIALAIGVGVAAHRGQDYYGNSQYWCWITEKYDTQRIMLEYFWMWLAAIGNIVLYVGLALVVKGMITFDRRGVHFHRSRHRLRDSFSMSQREGMKSNAIALQMLFYPAVYTITVCPITVVRWIAFSGGSVPWAATAFASVVFSLSGLFNVTLFKMTRPRLLPSHRHRASSSASVGISFGSSQRHDMRAPFDMESEKCSMSTRSPSSPSTLPPDLPPVIYIGPPSPSYYPNNSSLETSLNRA